MDVPEFCNGSVCIKLGDKAKVDVSHDEDCLLFLFEVKKDSACKKILLSIQDFQCYINLEFGDICQTNFSLLEHKISLFEDGIRMYLCLQLEKILLTKCFEISFCLGDSFIIKEKLCLV